MAIYEKSKVLKNPARAQPEKIVHYTPQYQVMGIEPMEYQSPPVSKNAPISKGAVENPRLPRAVVRQPYAEAISSPLGKGPVPNVGNNMEHTWSSLDGDIIDDISGEVELIDSEQEMIDNNEYVSAASLGLPEEIATGAILSDNFLHFTTCIQSVDDNDCVVFVRGMWLMSGTIQGIEENVQALIFGEHELCEGTPIPVEDILVIRKIPVKVGVFLR